MESKTPSQDWTLFPSELALRRFQQEEALRTGFVDASTHFTFARLRGLCLPYVKLKGEPLSPGEALLLQRQVAELARGYFEPDHPFSALSPRALEGVLETLIKELSALPLEIPRIVDWLSSHPPNHKLYALGLLANLWRVALLQEGKVDVIGQNIALLRLLRGSKNNWPPRLQEVRKIVFKSVSWLSPFEEACVLALSQKTKIRVESALPAAHAEEAEMRLGQRVQASREAIPWVRWMEELGDALAMDAPDLFPETDRQHIAFSCSAGAYGEIEDLARRICWYLEKKEIPPHRIALVVPDLSAVQDMVPHIFSRFQVPYFFRRGRPVLSSPAVKAFLAFLSLPGRPERDALIDLIRNPALAFLEREELVKKLQNRPPRLEHNDLPELLQALQTCSGVRAAALLDEYVLSPEDHFNEKAIQVLKETFLSLAETTFPLPELLDMVEHLLENEIIRPRDSHEQGVWILSPQDAAGLTFDLVLFASLNEGVFPAVPRQDALLSDAEREALRNELESQGRHLPLLALPQTNILFRQQSILFYSALGMARQEVVLSFQSVDQEGRERNESEYFQKLWNISGSSTVPSEYDQWRMRVLNEDSMFHRHWKRGMEHPEKASPVPGESFLPVIPLPLCRAADEALQSATAHPPAAEETDTPASPKIKHLAEMLRIEAERDAFLETEPEKRTPSLVCGYLGNMREKTATWLEQKQELSPSALEKLAENPYMFLLSQIFRIQDPKIPADTPDPRDRGGLIHAILRTIYSAIAHHQADLNLPRKWARKIDGTWRLQDHEHTHAIPLALFQKEHEKELLEFAERTAQKMMNEAIAQQKMLGHPAIWPTEQKKMMVQILNQVRLDVETAEEEHRYPAYFEYAFEQLDLQGIVRARGSIDRIDLIFTPEGELEKIRVLDYKGTSSARAKPEEYIQDIHRMLDAQLPIYALAAQKLFFEETHTPFANSHTEAGYLFYDRDFKAVNK